MTRIKVFQASQPDDIPVTVREANAFLASTEGRTYITVTETGASTGYSYTLTIVYNDADTDDEIDYDDLKEAMR